MSVSALRLGGMAAGARLLIVCSRVRLMTARAVLVTRRRALLLGVVARRARLRLCSGVRLVTTGAGCMSLRDLSVLARVTGFAAGFESRGAVR